MLKWKTGVFHSFSSGLKSVPLGMYSLFTAFHFLTAFAKYLVSVKENICSDGQKTSISGLAHSFGVHAAFPSSLYDGFSCIPGCFLSLFNSALD